MLDELGIGETINTPISQDFEQRQVTAGQAVKAMILNGLDFANCRLYLTPHFFNQQTGRASSGRGGDPCFVGLRKCLSGSGLQTGGQMMGKDAKYAIRLSVGERRQLQSMADEGNGSKEARRRARVLLKADESELGPAALGVR